MQSLQGFDWSTIDWNSIGAASGNLVGGWLGTNDTSTPSTGNNSNATAAQIAAAIAAAAAAAAGNGTGTQNAGGGALPPATKDNTMTYVAVGAGVLAIGYLLMQKSSPIRRRK